MKIPLLIASLLILFSCQTKTAQNTEKIDSLKVDSIQQKTTEEAITFGFSNEIGNKTLAFEENTNPKLFTQAIDNQGNISAIRFLNSQKSNENGVNLTSINFNNCAGQVFEFINGEKFVTEFTSVIFNEEFSKNHPIISVKTLDEPQLIDHNTKQLISSERNRAIKSAWKIADLGDKQSAYIVIFTPKKDSVLASLVIGNKQFLYRDYPAKYDEGSTWRVDDGGEFPNDAIRILAVFRNLKGELEIITEWAGAEGANVEYFRFINGKYETIKETSRYWGAG